MLTIGVWMATGLVAAVAVALVAVATDFRVVGGAQRANLEALPVDHDLQPVVIAFRQLRIEPQGVGVGSAALGEADIEVESGLKTDQEIVRGPSRVLKTLKDGMTVKRQTKKPGNANESGAS